MSLIVRAFPLQAPQQALEAFVAALNTERRADTDAFYRRFGISHESWHLQQTPQGPWVIGVTTFDDHQDAAARFANSSDDFEVWFKRQVRELSGVDPDQQPLGPPTTCVFDWSDDRRPGSNLRA